MKTMLTICHVGLFILGLAMIILAVTGLVIPVGHTPAAVPFSAIWSGLLCCIFAFVHHALHANLK